MRVPKALTVETVERDRRPTGRTGTSAPSGTPAREVGARQRSAVAIRGDVPADAALTRPYFTRPDEEQPYYDLTDPRYRNLPLAPYPLAVHARRRLPRRAV